MKEKNKNETNSWIKWYKATLELTETTILAHKIRKKLVEEGYTVVQITFKRNASSATAERLFHF